MEEFAHKPAATFIDALAAESSLLTVIAVGVAQDTGKDEPGPLYQGSLSPGEPSVVATG